MEASVTFSHMIAGAMCVLTVGACGGPQPEAAPARQQDAAVQPSEAKTWPPSQPSVPEVAVTRGDHVKALRVASIGSDNPYAEVWKQAPYYETPLQAQQMAMPTIPAPTVPALRAQALRDGERIAFRLSWQDSTADGNVDSGQFTDAVAIEFPLDAGAAPMMGHKGAKVQILHWKALWQKDLDVGFQDVQDLHPNYWYDLYWFAEGKFPFPVKDGAFKDKRSLQWFIAQSAGNPMAVFSRTQPVEELVAEGFGSLTHQPESASTGKGAWVKGTWAVVISRPLTTSDATDYQFKPGNAQIAFAVWQGGAGNVGGRKNWTSWSTLEVTP
jgi:hypothetical protein